MSLFAGNLSHRATPEEIRSFFSKFGPCRVDVKRGYAFIDYDNDRDAEDARNGTNATDFYGMKLNVEWSKKHIARTGGSSATAGEWDRRRSRYADERRYRDYDRDYERDNRRRFDYERGRYGRDREYDRDFDRDYDRRPRNVQRDYDRDRENVVRYNRGRDRDRRDRDSYDRENRYDRPRDQRDRSPDRSAERGADARPQNDVEANHDGRRSDPDSHVPNEQRSADVDARPPDDGQHDGRAHESFGNGKRNEERHNSLPARGAERERDDKRHPGTNGDVIDDDNSRRRPREYDNYADRDGTDEDASDRKRLRRDEDDDRYARHADDTEATRRGRDYEDDGDDHGREHSGDRGPERSYAETTGENEGPVAEGHEQHGEAAAEHV